MSAAAVEQAIAAFALHALWQVPLLAGAAWAAVRMGRPAARIAHAVWLGTLLLCVALPVCSTVAARRAAVVAERARASASVSYDTLEYAGALPPMERQPAWKRLLHRHVNSRDGLQPFAVAVPQRWARVITCAWMLAAVFFAVQLCIGWARVRALVRGASDDPLPEAVANALQQQCERLGMPVPLAKLHEGIAGPLLAGVAHATLLLPAASAAAMGVTEIEAVLAHELSHLRRRDPMIHAACSLLLVPVGFHPAALWAARCVRQTREMACDAEAAERMGSSGEYAWALLQVAERTNIGKGPAATAGFFSNGLFGAGLQLFTNRGAMEERMQMLVNGNGAGVRGRVVRVAAGISLAAVAVLAAGMLQVQPTLAAERGQAQAAASQKASAPAAVLTEDGEPALISGEHAQEQLRRAQRQLRQAASQATSADDRKKIEGAQQVIVAAQQALSAADSSSGPRVHLDLSGLDHLDVQFNSPEWKAQMDKQHEAMAKLQAQLNSPEWKAQIAEQKEIAAKLHAQFESPEWKAQMDRQREAAAKLSAQLNSPEWKAQLQEQKELAAKLHAQFNSPEWKAQMEKQREAMKELRIQMNSPEFRAQIEQARSLDRTKIEAMMADARKQQERAMEQMRSGVLQRQMDEARLMARLDPAITPMPAPFASPSPDAGQPDPDKPVRISPGVMAGNKVGGSDPVYPAAAKEKRIQGTVLLHAIIDKTGKVESIQVVSSPDDSLSKSAVAAVQTWTYRPYLLNGDARAVDTTVSVNFSLMP